MTLNEPDWGDFVQNACLRLTIALLGIYFLFACGSAHEHPPLITGDSSEQATPVRSNELASERCNDGDSRSCTLPLPAQGSVMNCVSGVQICSEGHWGACSEAD
ncbi:MAG: hypothetical protein ACOY0T_36885 [Myxococcota bacterium]